MIRPMDLKLARIKAGTYQLQKDARWNSVLVALRSGKGVVNVSIWPVPRRSSTAAGNARSLVVINICTPALSDSNSHAR